ncbi:MAG: Cu2+-exporting ATPase [Verrucomicrobiales bacterium]|jgi:Cu2+-exporting ATPase
MSATAYLSADHAEENAAKACVHCGTTFETANPADQYCCSGCAFVHDLIQQGGLDRFYDLKGTTTIQPVGTRAFRPCNWDWLKRLTSEAETSANDDGKGGGSGNSDATLLLKVRGLSCVGCVWLIKKVFEDKPGAVRIDVSSSRGTADLRWQPGAFNIVDFADDLQRFGYPLVERSSADDAGQNRSQSEGRRIAVCGAFAANAMAFSLPRYLGMPETFVLAPTFELIGALTATLSFAVGGTYFIHRAWQSLRAGVLHVDTPIALGVVTAYIGSLGGWMTGTAELLYFDFVSVFIFLMLLGRRVQTAAIERNQRLMPASDFEERRVELTDGKTVAVPALQRGMIFNVPPGDIVPVSGRLRSEATSVGTESINGERDPRSIEPGGIIPSGAGLLGNGVAELEAVESWPESLLCQLVNARESDSAQRSPMEHVLRGYLVAVLVFGIGGYLAYSIMGQMGVGLQVMISVFVVSCPCALGVALPLADDLASARMAAIGVYVKRANLWQRLLKVRKIFLDKTGTLTPESITLQNPEQLDDLPAESQAALLAMTASSLHPLSRTLYSALATQATTRQSTSGTTDEIVGKGLRLTEANGDHGDKRDIWELGRDGTEAPHATQLRRNGQVIATFHFEDTPRAGARAQIAQLHRQGLQFHILSGDTPEKVAAMAAAVGIPDEFAHGALKPDDKAQRIKQLGGTDALYLGDGANDSIAVGEVLCSGALVADASLLQDKADFYVMGQSFRFLGPLLNAARQRCRAVRHAFTFAVLYNAVCLTIALSGNMNPLLAAILMPLSSVVTIGIVRWSR